MFLQSVEVGEEPSELIGELAGNGERDVEGVIIVWEVGQRNIIRRDCDVKLIFLLLFV